MKSIEIALAVILSPDGKSALTAKRLENAHLGGFWEFPGGKIEPEETSEEAVIRESLEETGLNVKPLKKLTAVSYDFEDRKICLHPHLCAADSLAARPLASSEIRWVKLADLMSVAFPPVNFRIVAEVLEQMSE